LMSVCVFVCFIYCNNIDIFNRENWTIVNKIKMKRPI